MDRILFIFGNDVLPGNIDLSDTEKLFNIAGGNVGNFVYKYYLKSYLNYDKEHSQNILDVQQIESIQDIDTKFDKCVVICANQISRTDDALLQFYHFFKQTTLPIILLGLGAQSDLNYSMAFLDNIPKHIKLLKCLSEKKAIIGCRGKFSYHVLKKIGFKKVFIIGCPSYYKNGFNFILKKKEIQYENLLTDISFDWFENRDVWYNLAIKIPNFHVICQSSPEIFLYRWSMNQTDSDTYKVLENLFKINQEIIIKNKDVFQNHVSLFFNVTEWESFIKTRDFYIGPKIHGCLMHILNGRPGFLIVHDSRTREFAELFKIPHMLSSDLSADTNIKDIYSLYECNAIHKRYTRLFYNYLCFLDYCNLKYSFKGFTLKHRAFLLLFKLKFYISNIWSSLLYSVNNFIIYKKITENKKIIKFLGIEVFKLKKQNFKKSKYLFGIKIGTSFDAKEYIDYRINSLQQK